MRIQRENGSAFVGMQHGQRRVCPFSLPSKCSFPAEAQEFLHDIVKDQHGCRFLQETFEEGTSQEGHIIFNEIIDHVAGLGFLALMKDLNGNHVVQWDLATILSVTRNLKRLFVRFPKPMVKMKSMKYVGQARPKSWRWVNVALRLTYKCLLIIAFDILVRLLRWIQDTSVAHSLEARVPSFLEDKEALGGVICCMIKQREVNVSCEEGELVAEAKEEEKKCIPARRNGHIRQWVREKSPCARER